MRSKRFLWAGGLVVLLAVLAAAALFYLSRQPAYALARLVHACDTRNVEEFHKYFDTEGVVESGLDDILSALFRGKVGPDNPMAGLAGLARPMLVAQSAAALDAAVAEGRLGNGQTRDMSDLTLLVLSSRVSRQRGFKAVRIEDDTATVTLVVKSADSGAEAEIGLLMRREEGAWKVVGIKNLAALLRLGLGGAEPPAP